MKSGLGRKLFGCFDGDLSLKTKGKYIVSTVMTPELGLETAIIDANGAHPVQRYDTEEDAVNGHYEWVEWVKKGGGDIVQLGDKKKLIKSEVVTLVKRGSIGD